jgi:hypothetical protein
MEAEKESIRLAMDEAWRDHQHTRDQTWKALQIEFLLVVGVVGAIWQLNSLAVTIMGTLFVLLVTLCGVQITLRHRNTVERRKFNHILNCEEALGLHDDKLIANVTMPVPISIYDAFNPCKGNTAIFILRMHLVIMVFALFVLFHRLV